MASPRQHRISTVRLALALAGFGFAFESPAQAQVSLTATDFLKVRDTGSLTMQPILPGKGIDFDTEWAKSGEGRTWEYTLDGLAAQTAPYVIRPASEANRPIFADAELNEYAPGLTDRMFSYSPGKDTLRYIGHSLGSNYRYFPSVVYLTFPLKRGDSAAYASTLYANAQQSIVAGSLKRYWVLDGTGTLKRNGTITEGVMRVRTWQEDSSSILKQVTRMEEILWLKSGGGLPVFRLHRLSHPLTGSSVTAYHSGTGTGAGIPRGVRAGSGFALFRNDAAGFLEVRPGSGIALPPYRLRVLDADGRVLLDDAGSPRRVPLANLPPRPLRILMQPRHHAPTQLLLLPR